jgi:hypothetical protein
MGTKETYRAKRERYMGVLQERCSRCGHSFSFHSKRSDVPCKAIGCHSGPDGRPCQGFLAREDASEELLKALSPSP